MASSLECLASMFGAVDDVVEGTVNRLPQECSRNGFARWRAPCPYDAAVLGHDVVAYVRRAGLASSC